MTFRYVLDTNIVSDIVRHPAGLVVQRIARAGESRVCTSIVVACELRFGVAQSGSAPLARQLDRVPALLEALPLDAPVEHRYAEIRRRLGRAGTPIGPNDLLLAAQALALGLTLVTDNAREVTMRRARGGPRMQRDCVRLLLDESVPRPVIAAGASSR